MVLEKHLKDNLHGYVLALVALVALMGIASVYVEPQITGAAPNDEKLCTTNEPCHENECWYPQQPMGYACHRQQVNKQGLRGFCCSVTVTEEKDHFQW